MASLLNTGAYAQGNIIPVQTSFFDCFENVGHTEKYLTGINREKGVYRSIELFAGAGGLALGLEKAGFGTIGLIEYDRDAANTLKTNRPEWNVINEDIANISVLDLEHLFNIRKGDLDLLSGGAPCQAFSYAGKRLGLEDARGTLFYHYAVFCTSCNQGFSSLRMCGDF